MSSSRYAVGVRLRYALLFAFASVPLLHSPAAQANTAPKIGGTPVTSVSAAHYYAFQPWATDSDGDHLSFAVSNKPAWATFDSATGRLYGTPLPANVGTFSNIVISVSDGTYRAYLPAFSVTVKPLLNSPPVVSGTPPSSVTVGSSYSFTPTATDPNGLKIVFGIVNKPSWALFNSTTGQLYGTPTALNVGIFSNIQIVAYDGYFKGALPAFSITVKAASAPPTLSGAPPTSVNAGQAYSFQPASSSPSGNPLTFSIQNKPAWAAFNSQSGLLSGTPAAADVGTYSNIVIAASDGSAAATLPAFNLSVNQVSNGSATVSWITPTLNTDGTPLTDLVGYNLYWGSGSTLDHFVRISNPGLTSYVVSNLSSGTWSFCIQAINSQAQTSDDSQIVTVVVP